MCPLWILQCHGDGPAREKVVPVLIFALAGGKLGVLFFFIIPIENMEGTTPLITDSPFFLEDL